MDRRKLRRRGTGYVHVVKSRHHHVARHGEPEFRKRVDQLRRNVVRLANDRIWPCASLQKVVPEALRVRRFGDYSRDHPAEICRRLTELGRQPVWKDWDASFDLFGHRS